MKALYTVIFCLITLPDVFAQQKVISGVVEDDSNGQPLSYSSVFVAQSTLGAGTNEKGQFTLSIPQPLTRSGLVASCMGYKSDTITLRADVSYYIIRLKPVPGALNEIVVTGVSRATLARENPVPVVSVSKIKIEQATESNVIDVLVKNVPGLNAVKTGPNISKPFIRGLGYNRVLTLYDGIRQEGQQWGDEHGIEVDAYNIDRAEVVKGPSSLIYGSDAVAGVVGLMPAMPATIHDPKLYGQYSSEYQSNNGLIGNGMRLFFNRGRWGYALGGSYRIAKNYTNAVDGRVYNTGFRETNASGTVKYNGNKGYSSLSFTMYNNLQGIPDGSRDSLTRQFTYQTQEGNADDIKSRPVVPDAVLKSYQLSPLHQHIQHYRVYSRNNYQLGAGNFDFLLAFQQNIRREYNHPTDPDQAGMFVQLNTVNYSMDYHLPLKAHVELSTGINGMYQNNSSKDATDFPIPDYNLFDAGIYGFIKWKYQQWTFSGGLRYDRRYLSGRNMYLSVDPATGFNRQVTGAGITGANLQFPAFNKDFHGLSFSMGATYALSEHVSMKANLARGYRAPSITELASNGLDPGAHIIYLGNKTFQPEFSLQEDIGIEISVKDIAASLSGFNNNISNYIYLAQEVDASGNPIVDAQGNKTYKYQQARAQLFGLEATLNLHPAVLKGFSWDNALSVTYGFNRKVTYQDKGVGGEYLPLIPPLRLLSSINWDLELRSTLLSTLNLKAEADMSAAQNRYLALNNTETATPGYVLFNVAAGTKLHYSSRHSVQLQLQVNNLFDLAFQSNLNRLKYFEYYAASPNGRSGIYNMGRNICFKTIFPF